MTWKVGTKYEDVTPRSREDKRALETLERTVKHVCDRYVGMLWREGEVKFPDNSLASLTKEKLDVFQLQNIAVLTSDSTLP